MFKVRKLVPKSSDSGGIAEQSPAPELTPDKSVEAEPGKGAGEVRHIEGTDTVKVRKLILKPLNLAGHTDESPAAQPVHDVVVTSEGGEVVDIGAPPVADALEPSLEQSLEKVLGVISSKERDWTIVSDVNRTLIWSFGQVRKDLNALPDSEPLPNRPCPADQASLIRLIDPVGPVSATDTGRVAELVRYYAQSGQSELLQISLARWSALRSRQLFDQGKRREARAYILTLMHIYPHLNPTVQTVFQKDFYSSVSNYFGSYNIYLKGIKYINSQEHFYYSLFKTIPQVPKRKLTRELGRCLLEIAGAYSWFVSDMINRAKTRSEYHSCLTLIAEVLRDTSVFRADPVLGLKFLAQIDVKEVPTILGRQTFGKVEDRRLTAISLIKYLQSATLKPAEVLRTFPQQSQSETRVNLAFSVLVEPPVSATVKQENQLKAQLISSVFGFQSGNATTEFFVEKTTELADLLNQFTRNVDPNVKGQIGYSIFDAVSVSRKLLVERLRGDSKSDIIQFYRAIEGYVRAEQSKLIRDTTLEIGLVVDRAVYSPTDTRVTLEVRNVGEGIAEGLELEVYPVLGQYKVEDRHRIYNIDILPDKTPIQQVIFVQPEVGASQHLELRVTLRYNTLREKNKTVELPDERNSVWLYPESHFVRVAQPYNTGLPATTWFYGRQNLLDTLADNLHTDNAHDNSMIVYGLKRAGKTSVVKRFLEHTLNERGLIGSYFPIYSDLLAEPLAISIKSDGDFLCLLAKIILEDSQVAQSPRAMNIQLPSLANGFGAQPYETFSLILNEVLAGIAPRKLLIVLDEFSTLQDRFSPASGNSLLTPALSGYLSNTIQRTNQLTFIFTGTYIMLEMMRNYTIDLAKISAPYMVGFLDEVSARQLVVEPVAPDPINPNKGWLTYDPRVVDYIVRVTNNHPFLIQYMCNKLVARMNDLKQNTVNLNDITQISQEIVTKALHGQVMRLLWDEFDERQRKVLSCVATLSTSQHDWVELGDIVDYHRNLNSVTPPEAIQTICSSLADAELLEYSTVSGTDAYRITIPIYQEWIKLNKP